MEERKKETEIGVNYFDGLRNTFQQITITNEIQEFFSPLLRSFTYFCDFSVFAEPQAQQKIKNIFLWSEL